MSIERSNREDKGNEEKYDNFNTAAYNAANKQAFVNTEQVLFELASAERLSILSRLSEEKGANNLSTLSKDLNIVVQEIHRHINRLLEAELIQKISTNSYSLTAFGAAVLTQIPMLNFLARNKSYFSAHTFGGLPIKFIQRLGALSDSQYLENQVSIFEHQRDLLSNAENYLYVIIPQIPLYLIDTIMPRLEAKTIRRNESDLELKYLLPYNAILPKRRHSNLKHSAFYELLNREIVQRRMLERVDVGIIVNENQSLVMFPMASKKGVVRGERMEEQAEEIDMNSGFYSTNATFHEWCVDYFNHMWQIAKPFNPNKLSEV